MTNGCRQAACEILGHPFCVSSVEFGEPLTGHRQPALPLEAEGCSGGGQEAPKVTSSPEFLVGHQRAGDKDPPSTLGPFLSPRDMGQEVWQWFIAME